MRKKIKIRIFKERITKYHILQSLLACVYILITFWVMHSLQSKLAVASLGASAFLVFSFPHKHASSPRFLIGGYFVGTISGLVSACAANTQIIKLLPISEHITACALAMFMAMLLMTVFDFEHPPSAAFAVTIAMDSRPAIIGLAGLSCITMLYVIKRLLKKYMRDL